MKREKERQRGGGGADRGVACHLALCLLSLGRFMFAVLSTIHNPESRYSKPPCSYLRYHDFLVEMHYTLLRLRRD